MPADHATSSATPRTQRREGLTRYTSRGPSRPATDESLHTGMIKKPAALKPVGMEFIEEFLFGNNFWMYLHLVL